MKKYKYKIGDLVQTTVDPSDRSYATNKLLFYISDMSTWLSGKTIYSLKDSNISYYESEIDLYCSIHRSIECPCLRNEDNINDEV